MTPYNFLKLFELYTGNKVSKVRNIETVKMTGAQLYEFVSFMIRRVGDLEKLREIKEANAITRIVWFTFGFLLTILIFIFADEFNLSKLLL